jgi:hypothetical protein
MREAEKVLRGKGGISAADYKTLYKGREGMTGALTDKASRQPAAPDPKTQAATPRGRAAVFEASQMNQPGGEARMQYLKERTQANKQRMAQGQFFDPDTGNLKKRAPRPIPLGAEDIATQEYMMKHKGKSPGVMHRLMNRGGGPTQDWTWDAGADSRPGKNQPYYSKGGPKIHETPGGAVAGDPASKPTGGRSRIPGPTPGQQAPGSTTAAKAPPTPPKPPVEGAGKAKGLFGGRLGRLGKVGLGVGALGLLAGGLFGGRSKEQQQPMRPVYSPLASYGQGSYAGF